MYNHDVQGIFRYDCSIIIVCSSELQFGLKAQPDLQSSSDQRRHASARCQSCGDKGTNMVTNMLINVVTI